MHKEPSKTQEKCSYICHECIDRLWKLKLVLWENLFEHLSHWYGFLFKCLEFIWPTQSLVLAKILKQNWHWKRLDTARGIFCCEDCSTLCSAPNICFHVTSRLQFLSTDTTADKTISTYKPSWLIFPNTKSDSIHAMSSRSFWKGWKSRAT